VAGIRQQLLAHQTHMISMLDALLESYATYLQTREELLQASKRFAQADSERQAHIEVIESLLPALLVNSDLSVQMPSAMASSTPSPEIGLFDSDLYITCFGNFGIFRAGKAVALCSSRNGQAILRYLVAQPRRSTTIDTLLALFWPQDEAEVARRKLHIAISALRRSLQPGDPSEPGIASILCKNRIYSLNPEMSISTDVEEFLQCYASGHQATGERVAFYERACRLYAGPFLTEDLYADWSFLQREQLAKMYITMCRELADHYLHVGRYEDATKWSQAVLKENRCDETAHRQLMYVYAAQGNRSEALQQYHSCERILHEELGVSPLPETTHLLQRLLARETP
jgi:DNA-binding SARP family transcriptional activator